MSDVEIEYITQDGVGEINVSQYPSGEPLIPWGTWNNPVLRVLLRPRTMQTFLAAMWWIDALVERGYNTPELILPFVPGARQDRLNESGDYLFTIKSVAKMLNERNFPQVIVLDPHSEVTPALIDRCRIVTAAQCLGLLTLPDPYAAVISPDAGAEKRAGTIARYLGVPLIHAWKTRDVSDGKITGFGIEPNYFGPQDQVLVVDDICDGGGTFIGLAENIHAEADLWVTHGLFSKGVEELDRFYMRMICTDSIIATRPGVTVLPVCQRLLTLGEESL